MSVWMRIWQSKPVFALFNRPEVEEIAEGKIHGLAPAQYRTCTSALPKTHGDMADSRHMPFFGKLCADFLVIGAEAFHDAGTV